MIQREIRMALDMWQEKMESDIYLLPVRLEECQIPESLANFQYVDLFRENGWIQLFRAIQAGVERRAQAECGLGAAPLRASKLIRYQPECDRFQRHIPILGLLERFIAPAKKAELQILTDPKGHNEGRRFLITKKRITIGSSSRDDWVILGDPRLYPGHIEIRQEGGRFILFSRILDRPAEINGLPVGSQTLLNHDRIQLGATLMIFKMK